VPLPNTSDLKFLQVKAELSKLGDPSRAYAEKLNNNESMMIDTTENHKLTIDQRFTRIQGARPEIIKRPNQQVQKKTLRVSNQPKQAGSRR